MNLRSLPPRVQDLFDELNVPARLRWHSILVHDVASEVVDRLRRSFQNLSLDDEAILQGAALHDLGKILHPEELIGPGKQHEIDGPQFLEENGIEPHIARFARTHGSWKHEIVGLDDLVVALADNLWKGRRNEELEAIVVEAIARQMGQEKWLVFGQLDEIFAEIASEGASRLAMQLRE